MTAQDYPASENPSVWKTGLYTAISLLAFASNSILCRLALGEVRVDAASFTTIRLASGALTLLCVLGILGRRGRGPASPRRFSAPMLFAYAVCFSFAYRSLEAGTGALILFGAVQVTMIVTALVRGERPGSLEWLGFGIAFSGLVYLLSPGLGSPPLAGSVLMASAGSAWGIYSLLGKGVSDPVVATAQSFLYSLPLSLLMSLLALKSLSLTPSGVLLAGLSGSLASGLGYVSWYAALQGLSATRAAIVQLSVPVVAAAGGVLLLSETVSYRLVLSAILVLGGVGLAVLSRPVSTPPGSERELP